MTAEVLIVSYNTRELLRDCLASIQAEGSPDIAVSVAVWDNGSGDGSAEMVEREFPEVRLVRSTENLGFGAANNRLAATSQADLLLLLNSDTVFIQDVISPLAECLRAYPRAVAVGPRLELPDGQRQASYARFPRLWHEFVLLAEGVLGPRTRPFADRLLGRVETESAREVEVLWATCWLMRRRDVLENGLFDDAFRIYDEDFDFCRRMQAAGRTFIYEPSVTLVHRSGASASPAARSVFMRRSRQSLYRRHRGPLTAVGYRLLTYALSLAAPARAWVSRPRLPPQ